MEAKVFWGERGEFGPFTRQQDGWPHAGEVIRHYRRLRHMSAETLALRYSEELVKHFGQENETRVTARWMLKMEQKNQIPTDIIRRRILAMLLDVPPFLLGLASLEQVHVETSEEQQKISPILHHRFALDLSLYETTIRAFWQLNETSHAHDVVEQVLASITQLEEFEKQAKGDAQSRIRELLYSHYRLACRVYRDMMKLPKAYYYANQAVRVTKLLGRGELTAAALYVRGFICLVWGAYGEHAVYGMIEQNRKKFVEALQDFEQALPLARPQLKGLLQLEMSRVQGWLKNSATDITIALRTMELAEKVVESEGSSVDPYTRMVGDGTLHGLNAEEYLLGRAITFNATNRPDRALEAFDHIERLDEKRRRGKNYTRHHAWIDVVQAQSYAGMKEYAIATNKATKAFIALRDIDCIDVIAEIVVLYEKLCKSTYRHSKELDELGTMITNYYHTRRKGL